MEFGDTKLPGTAFLSSVSFFNDDDEKSQILSLSKIISLSVCTSFFVAHLLLCCCCSPKMGIMKSSHRVVVPGVAHFQCSSLFFRKNVGFKFLFTF